MIFLFPLDVVLPIVVLAVVGPLFGGIAVVVDADVLNTAPLLCAAVIRPFIHTCGMCHFKFISNSRFIASQTVSS